MLDWAKSGAVWLLMLGGCDLPGVTYKGPGDPQPPIPTMGDTAAENTGNACDKRNINGTCILFTGVGWDENTMRASCDGVFTDQGCPPSDLGGCRLAQDEAIEQVVYYYQGPYYVEDDLEYLRGNCEVNFGEWQ